MAPIRTQTGRYRCSPWVSELGCQGSSVGSDCRSAAEAISISATARANASESTGAIGAIERATALPPLRLRPTAKFSIDAGLAPTPRGTVCRAPPRLDAVWRVSLDCALSTSRKPCAFLFSIAKHPNQSRLISVVKVAFTSNIDQSVTLMWRLAAARALRAAVGAIQTADANFTFGPMWAVPLNRQASLQISDRSTADLFAARHFRQRRPPRMAGRGPCADVR